MRGLILILGLLLSPLVALAQFVEPPLLDNCNRVEDPLSSSGQWTQKIVSTVTGFTMADGTTCGRSGSGDGSSWWNVTAYGPDTRVSMTIPDALAAGGALVELQLRLESPGVVTSADGYGCRFRPFDSDILMRRLDNSVGSTLATCTAITMTSGDRIGCEMIGTALKAYLNTGASWVEVCSATSATYTAAGFVGWVTNSNQLFFDDIRGGTATAAAPASAIGAIMPMIQ